MSRRRLGRIVFALLLVLGVGSGSMLARAWAVWDPGCCVPYNSFHEFLYYYAHWLP